MHLDQKVSLKALHTFGMEAEARYFVEAKTHSEVLTLLNYRHMIHMPILFLGGGSNILFLRNFAGIVIRINSKGIVIRDQDENHVFVTAEAGENWDEFVQYCVGNHWAGLENLSLIPGTVGAAPIQNIGAYGVEVKDLIDSVQVVEINSGKQKRFTNADCQFGYRDSVFKRELKGKVIILNVTFKLLKTIGNPATIPPVHPSTRPLDHLPTCPPFLKLDYGDIRPELNRLGVSDPTISDVREAVCNIRRRKLPDPAEIGNAGSFFKNPVISHERFSDLKNRFPGMPCYLLSGDKGPLQGNISNSENLANPDHLMVSDHVKLPAAWLIEQCGWKGYRSGDAGVHPDQPLVLVNYGTATGPQIIELANQIVDSVEQKFGIRLEMEVNVVG
jgi:UDP-N-acetylmuramate dehydrogenase